MNRSEREFAFEPGKLTDEQRKAFAHILASRDLVMDVSGIAGAGKSHLLKQVQEAAVSVGKSVAILSPTDASVKNLRKTGFRARTFQGFQLRPESAELLVTDEASMLSVPQMLWLVKHARENRSRVLLAGDSAQHRSVERGDALRILEQSGSVRYVELLQTQRQRAPALKGAIEDLKAGRLENGWDKLERHGVIKEVTDGEALQRRAVEKWTVTQANCETVMFERNGKVREFKPSAKGKWDVYTRDKAALRQSVMYPGERKSVWELIRALRRPEPQSRNRMMPDLWATRQAEIVREIGMER